MKSAPCLLVFGLACAGSRAITGQVIERNGAPVPQAIVSLEPGNVEVLTDETGRFAIGYLREDDGDRKALALRTEYRLEAFKVGFHLASAQVAYRTGQLRVEPVTLAPDTIDLPPAQQALDPARFPDAVRSAGATYEGE
jgi:hypothetical protein